MDQKQETNSNDKSNQFKTIGNFLKKQREQQELLEGDKREFHKR